MGLIGEHFKTSLLCVCLALTLSIPTSTGSQKCFSPFGCFEDDVFPFPKSPETIETRFWLFTREQRNTPELLSASDVNQLKNTSFDVSLSTKVIIHGYSVLFASSILQTPNFWGISLKETILNNERTNVIIVDWIKGATWEYKQSAANTRLVGAQLALLLQNLASLFVQGVSATDSFHVIGFSLGSHVAGAAGKILKTSGISLGRITGLDPAGPLFVDLDKELRLDASHAQLVDNIHTTTVLGINKAIGHMDFFVNGGSFQNGCDDLDTAICGHFRATKYFIESINSACPWRAYSCGNKDTFNNGGCLSCQGDCVSMGYHTAKRDGKYYLLTSDKAPFCGYHYLVSFYTASAWGAGTRGKPVVKLEGSKGASHNIELITRDFKSGSKESFVALSSMELGSLSKVTVWWTPSLLNLFDSWKIDKLTVQTGWDSNQRYTTCIDKWIKPGQANKVTFALQLGDISC